MASFEDKLKDKFESHRVNPSREVWEDVESHLNKQRWQPLIWLFLLPSLVLVGYFLVSGPLNNSVDQTVAQYEEPQQHRGENTAQAPIRNSGEPRESIPATVEGNTNTPASAELPADHHAVSRVKGLTAGGTMGHDIPPNGITTGENAPDEHNLTTANPEPAGTSNEILFHLPIRMTALPEIDDIQSDAGSKINDHTFVVPAVKRNSIAIGILLQPEMSWNRTEVDYDNNSPYKPNVAFDQRWRGWSVGVDLMVPVNRHLNVQAGLLLAYHKETWQQQPDEIWNSQEIPSDANPNDTLTIDTTDRVFHQEIITPEIESHRDMLLYLTIPVSVNLRLGQGSFFWEIGAGMAYSRLISSNTETFHPHTWRLLSSSGNDAHPYRINNLDALLQLGMGYRVNERLDLIFKPQGAMRLNSLYEPEFPVENSQYRIGTRLGIYYNF